MIQAVIIDVDDTLCLTEAACFEIENETLVLMGRAPQTREIHKQTWGQPLFEAIEKRSPGVDAKVFRQLFEEGMPGWVANKRLDDIGPDRIAVLDDLLHIQGKELFILTSRTHGEVKHMLAAEHDLSSRIKAFYYRDVMQYHKPDPRAFDVLIDDHSLKHSECVYVGDSPSDAAAAKQSGMHFIASLESGLRTKDDFTEFPVDEFIDQFTELAQAVSTLEGRL